MIYVLQIFSDSASRALLILPSIFNAILKGNFRAKLSLRKASRRTDSGLHTN